MENVGDFKESLSTVLDGLALTFSPSAIPLKQRWRNNGLSADFLADYVISFFPRDEGDAAAEARQADIRGAVAYIANELLENAMKYSSEVVARPTTIRLILADDAIFFSETNTTSRAHGDSFRAFVRELNESDPSEMYLSQMERTAEGGGGSGLGLLTMINDYGAKLAWRFEDIENGDLSVTTQVRLDF